VESRLFWKSLIVQTALVGVLFAILVALPLGEDFFEDYGWITGPVAWFGCSVLTARVLGMPAGYVVFSAIAGGVCGALVMLVTSHWTGLLVALLVFAASNATYDPDAVEEDLDSSAAAK
jgi:RsiW-degrading membrane proteinase PrsW (M82 family)